MTTMRALFSFLLPRTLRLVHFLSNMTHIHGAGPATGWLRAALATGLILLIAQVSIAHVSPAIAQPEHGGYEPPSSSPEAVQRGPEGPAGASLPPWAEPQRPSPHSSSPNGDPGLGSPVTTNGIGPPDNPNRVPLGGIEWLMLAGAGYGIFRLRTAGHH